MNRPRQDNQRRVAHAFAFAFALLLSAGSAPAQSISVEEGDHGSINIANEFYRIFHDPGRGGSIRSIAFGKSGSALPVEMSDSLSQDGAEYRLDADTEPRLTVDRAAEGRTVIVSAAAHYRDPKRPRDGGPAVLYRYTYRAGSPVVRIDVEIPQQPVDKEFSNLQQFAFKFGKEKSFAKLQRLIPSGDGRIMPASFEFSPCEWRPNAGALYADGTNALAVITPVLGSARLDAEAGHVVSRAFLAQWAGRRLTSGATLVIGPSAEVEKQIADLNAYSGFRLVERVSQPLAESQKAAASARRPSAIESGDSVILASKHTALLFVIDKARVSLDAMSRAAHLFVRPTNEMRSMWQMTFKDAETGRLIPVDPTHAVAEHRVTRPDDKTVALVVRWPKIEVGKSFAEVTVTVTLRRDDPLSRWKIRVKPLDGKIGLWDVTFPIVTGIASDGRSPETDFLVFPNKSGVAMPNPTAAGLCESLYPGECGWQFMAYWQGNKGLYFGAHDPGASVKTLRSLPTGDGALELAMMQPVPNQGLPGNGYDMPYEVALGTFEGDWFDATQIYREWLVRQKWFPRKPLHATKDVPQWMKDVVVSTRRSGAPEGALDNSVEVHKDSGYKEYHTGALDEHKLLGEPATLFWWYHAWFQKAEPGREFAGTPDFAAPPGFADGVRRARSRNIRVISYSLCFWWDYNAESWKKENAERFACVQADGKPWLYGTRQVGIMCPATAFYQKKMQRVMNDLLDQGAVDGTYFDLGGTSGGSYCYSKEHGHPVGSGAWVADGKRTLMRGMREAARKRNPDFVLCMESNADCYLDGVDGYAMFEENVPVRQALYADYRRTAGSKRTTWENSKLEAINPAKQFAWGGTIGRFVGAELTSGGKTNENAVAYYRRLIAHKTVARPWLNLGRMLRPVPVTQLDPPSPVEVVADTMLPHGTWVAPDGSVAFAFANGCHSTNVSFQWQCDPAKYRIPANGKWALYTLEPKGEPPAPQWDQLGDIKGTIQRSEKLPPGGTLIVVAKPRTAPR